MISPFLGIEMIQWFERRDKLTASFRAPVRKFQVPRKIKCNVLEHTDAPFFLFFIWSEEARL
jgi:hypothetical protein